MWLHYFRMASWPLAMNSYDDQKWKPFATKLLYRIPNTGLLTSQLCNKNVGLLMVWSVCEWVLIGLSLIWKNLRAVLCMPQARRGLWWKPPHGIFGGEPKHFHEGHVQCWMFHEWYWPSKGGVSIIYFLPLCLGCMWRWSGYDMSLPSRGRCWVSSSEAWFESFFACFFFFSVLNWIARRLRQPFSTVISPLQPHKARLCYSTVVFVGFTKGRVT